MPPRRIDDEHVANYSLEEANHRFGERVVIDIATTPEELLRRPL